jgi:hypothetical protein
MEEAEREEEEGERKKRNLQRSWSRRKKRSPLLEDWDFLRYWLWEEGVLP